MFALVLAGCAGGDSTTGSAQAAGDAGQKSAIVGGVPGGPPAAVVLVVVDTLRADITSMTGHYRNTTPQMDKLAAKGVVFTAAYSPTCWTVPSMASLHTSRYPASHGIVNGAIVDESDRVVVRQQVLGDSFVTLAEVLQAAGYKTVGVASNRHLAADLGFGQGFDVYYDEAHFGDAKWFNQIAKAHLARAFGRNWASTFGSEPSFVWLHYFDPHIPYIPRLPWIRAFADDYIESPRHYAANRNRPELDLRYPNPGAHYRECALPLYEAEVAYWDDRFKRLADMLEVDSRDVLVVFTSDHGEQFGEHGGLGHRHGLYE
ncbi:MAG: sulfatase, partial [Deltaproteobacteria bacterium]|nr:sulfatase [Deltaproteobacteria bacterium]